MLSATVAFGAATVPFPCCVVLDRRIAHGALLPVLVLLTHDDERLEQKKLDDRRVSGTCGCGGCCCCVSCKGGCGDGCGETPSICIAATPSGTLETRRTVSKDWRRCWHLLIFFCVKP